MPVIIPGLPQDMLLIHAEYQTMMQRIGDAMRPHDDIPPQMGFLLAVIGDRCLSPDEIGRNRWAGTNPSYNIKRLCAAGLLSMTPHRFDGRRKLLSLTTEGLALAARIRTAMMVMEEEAA